MNDLHCCWGCVLVTIVDRIKWHRGELWWDRRPMELVLCRRIRKLAIECMDELGAIRQAKGE